MIKNTERTYGSIAKWFHWLVAFCFLAAYVVVYYKIWFLDKDDSLFRPSLNIHVAIGFSVSANADNSFAIGKNVVNNEHNSIRIGFNKSKHDKPVFCAYNNKVGILNTNPSYHFDTWGKVRGTHFIKHSDKRYKKKRNPNTNDWLLSKI